MGNLTISEGLAGAREFVNARSPAYARRGDHDDPSSHTLFYRWDFPAGGTVGLTIGYDLANGKDGPTFIPHVRATVSGGADAVGLLALARSVEAIIAVGVEVEALMRTHTYRLDAEPVAHAQNTDPRSPYPTPACGAVLVHPENAPGDYVVGRESTIRVTCGRPECQRANDHWRNLASRAVRSEEPQPRAPTTKRVRPARPPSGSS
jgi:hypothetical protein